MSLPIIGRSGEGDERGKWSDDVLNQWKQEVTYVPHLQSK
jgi:hypothetical protein